MDRYPKFAARDIEFAGTGAGSSHDRMRSQDSLNEPARILLAELSAEFPEWEQYASILGPEDHADAAPGSVQLSVPVPASAQHRLLIRQLGNTIEVAYDDARPPGPAEKLFVHFDEAPREVARAVVGFLKDLVSENIVVVREPIGPFVRFLRRDDAVGFARFLARSELTERRSGGSVVSWHGTHSVGLDQ